MFVYRLLRTALGSFSLVLCVGLQREAKGPVWLPWYQPTRPTSVSAWRWPPSNSPCYLRAIHTQVYLLSLPSRGLQGIFFFCLRWWFKTVISGSKWFSKNKSQLGSKPSSGPAPRSASLLPGPPPCFKARSSRKYWFSSPAGISLITMPVCWFIKGEKDKHYLGWGGLARRGCVCPLQMVGVWMLLYFLSWKNVFIFHYLSWLSWLSPDRVSFVDFKLAKELTMTLNSWCLRSLVRRCVTTPGLFYYVNPNFCWCWE